MTSFKVNCSILIEQTFKRIPTSTLLLVYEDQRAFLQFEGFNRELVKQSTYQKFGEQLSICEYGHLQYVVSFQSQFDISQFIALSGFHAYSEQSAQVEQSVNIEDLIEIIQHEGFSEYVDSVERVLLSLMK
ncbi:Hypothetical_protein [Hexamita inflata]|uniref:Hypothetical_protein n=1 Tax=Hexamita inflata TaxID=28002 RepID=A0AA86RQY9_9EUKA|nr:Hypothetical protein HINF_LOCUS64074 [Hexamita inflata]